MIIRLGQGYRIGMLMSRILDIIALLTALFAAWLWFKASSNAVRRVSREEELNALDINRIITAMNRSLILNRRAALASGVSATAIALKLLSDLLPASG